jgi:putative heme-binding domain-containing protein
MANLIQRLVLVLVLSLPWIAAAGQEVIPHRQDRLPNRPYTPEEALEAMTVPPGFAVELVASEPAIVNPIAMMFDDRGRIWITESLEYPRKEAGPGRDRVKVLEDTDGDGRADRVTVFVEGLNIPTGVAVGHGGVWVLNAPDLLFCQDTDGDGRADRTEVVVTGFGRADTHELPSTLTWGPDGWLYGFNGVFNPSRIRSEGKEYSFTCALWRVNPRTRAFQVVSEGTSNPYGLAWDREGSAIVEACHWANDHLFHFVETGYYKRQAGAYPPFTIRLGSITDHGHQKTAYCGLVYFDSDAYPPAYRDRLFTGNIHGGCINADVLARDGSTYVAHGEPDFLSANDAWFMPVALKVGPDGCLYVLDWYDRYHCYQDANRDPAGIDRLKGRLYRVRYGAHAPTRTPRVDLSSESDEQLVERLASPNIYFRESAQRLLSERNTEAIHARLERLVGDGSASRTARMHGLWALIGTGRLEPTFHGRLLDHADAGFRAWGVRAAGQFGTVEPAVRDKLARLARDPAPDVQLQVAIAARKVAGLDPLPILVEILSSCGEDKLIPAIAWANLHPLLPEQGERFVQLTERIDRRTAPALTKLLPRVVDRILAAPDAGIEPVGTILARLIEHEHEQDHDADLVQQCFSAVSERARELPEARRKALQAQLEPVIRRLLTGEPAATLTFDAQLLALRLGIEVGSIGVDESAVRDRFLATDQPETVRLHALEALIAFRDPGLGAAVSRVLSSSTSTSSGFLVRVLAVLGRSDDARVADALLARYPRLDPELQPLVIDLLLQREPWARKLLNSILAKTLPRSTLSANHLRQILESNDREAIWAVEKEWGTIRAERNPEREKVVRAMTEDLRRHPGDPKAGQQVFKKLCAQCHTIYGEGQAVGPDLTSNGRGSFDQLVTSVFDPSLVIGQSYQTTTVVTEDGRNLTGLVVEDSDRRIVLALPGGGKEIVARNDVKYTRVSKLSMMPEGIETILDRKELSDLFAFLALDRPPGDPKARKIPGATQDPAEAAAEGPELTAGVARADITPDYPVRLTGYVIRQVESEGIEQRLHARALALGDDRQGPVVLIAVESCALSAALVEKVADRLRSRTGLPRERLAVCVTHTHTAPALTGVLPFIFNAEVPPEHQERIDRYTHELIEKLEQVALLALADRRPCRLAWGQGRADFANNRRTIKDGRWVGFGENPGAPVDHTLPVLSVRDGEGRLRAILAGYACHCTALDGHDNKICGDWAGYASAAIERDHPGALGLIVIGCAGDANPRVRRSFEAARSQGEALADVAGRVLSGPLKPLSGPIAAGFQRIAVPFAALPTRAEWEAKAHAAGKIGLHARANLARLDRGERLPAEQPLPVQAWCFGNDLAMVFLGGEVVVDYALRLKREFDPERLWITAYANDVPCYIASRRVLAEGGYEVETSMASYDRPTRLAPDVEELVIGAVHEVVSRAFTQRESVDLR